MRRDPSTEPELLLRLARDEDADGVIALIARVFAEYPGCVLDVDREEPELRAPASSFERFWVLEEAGRIVGCCGYATSTGADRLPVLEMKKVYLDADLRGRGWGRRLIETIEQAARDLGIRRIELWSDTRFATAHAVYERLGYRRTGATRELHDLSHTTEYAFEKLLADR